MAPLLFVSAAPLRCARAHASRARPATSARPPRVAPRACEPATASAEMDAAFARLQHVNPNLRKKAAIAISEGAGAAEVERLLGLLEQDDTTHRRAAVDALGLIGEAAIEPVTTLMRAAPSSTARASCAKAMAKFCGYYPQLRATFPQPALDGLRTALQVDTDPVTKLSVVGCLGVLGSDAVVADGDDGAETRHAGCAAALDILAAVCENVADMGIAANAVASVAQIGQNAEPERRQRVMDILRKLSTLEDPDPESGVEYVRQMALGNLAQLEDGPTAGMEK